MENNYEAKLLMQNGGFCKWYECTEDDYNRLITNLKSAIKRIARNPELSIRVENIMLKAAKRNNESDGYYLVASLTSDNVENAYLNRIYMCTPNETYNDVCGLFIVERHLDKLYIRPTLAKRAFHYASEGCAI